MFHDLFQSSIGKAFKVSPVVQGVTLGPNAVVFQEEEESNKVSETFIVNEPPQISSTPKKYRLSGEVKRNTTKKSPSFEIKSAKEVQQMTLLAELAKKQLNDSFNTILALEAMATSSQNESLNQVSRIYTVSKNTKDAKKVAIEKALLKKIGGLNQVIGNETEKDKIAESEAKERSLKVRLHVEEAKKKKLNELMFSWHVSYTSEYRKLLEFLQNCPNPRALQESIAPLLRNLRDDASVTDSLRNKIQNDEIIPQDLETADILMKNLRNVSNVVEKEMGRIILAEKEKEVKKAEEERVKQAPPPPEPSETEEVEEKKSSSATESSTLSDCFTSESLEKFLYLRRHLANVQESLKPLLNDPAMNQFRLELSKAVTIPVNAISAVSPQFMMDKYKKLQHLLSGGRVNGRGVSAGDHPCGDLYLKSIMAKSFVRLGEKVVCSDPEAAFPIASILVNLWTEYPDLGELILAQFYKQCPYIAPVFLPQVEGQSNLDYYKSLGYLEINGAVEKQEAFLIRMKGIVRLYAAVLVTKPRNSNATNPLGLAEAWRWLAAILNLEPRPDICPVLIYQGLEVAGSDLMAVYKGQFKKMLAYICKEYFPRLDKVTAAGFRGPVSRLQSFLENVVKVGMIAPPAHRISPNFW